MKRLFHLLILLVIMSCSCNEATNNQNGDTGETQDNTLDFSDILSITLALFSIIANNTFLFT